MELVCVSVVPSEGEAEIALSLLRSEGIRAMHRKTNLAAALWSRFPLGGSSSREILVNEEDALRARELLGTVA